jgi:hypothetical protein
MSAVSRAGWALAAMIVLIQAVATIDFFVATGRTAEALSPLLALAVFAVSLAVLVVRPGRITRAVYLVVGAAATSAYLVAAISLGLGPDDIAVPGGFAAALALVGASGRHLSAAAWTVSGIVAGQGALMGTEWAMGLSPGPDAHALALGGIVLAADLVFWHTARQHRNSPDMASHEAEAMRQEIARQEMTRRVAIVHETILGDLSLVANGDTTMSERDRSRLRRDAEAVSEGRARVVSVAPSAGLPPDDLFDVVRDAQWRGMTINVAGSSKHLDVLGSAERDALLGGVRAALDNVIQHSGVSAAEVFVDRDSDALTVMVVDAGSGFDPLSLPEDRLGVRVAITQRIVDCGGSAAIWSSTGAGTSVVMSMPVGGGTYRA